MRGRMRNTGPGSRCSGIFKAKHTIAFHVQHPRRKSQLCHSMKESPGGKTIGAVLIGNKGTEMRMPKATAIGLPRSA